MPPFHASPRFRFLLPVAAAIAGIVMISGQVGVALAFDGDLQSNYSEYFDPSEQKLGNCCVAPIDNIDHGSFIPGTPAQACSQTTFCPNGQPCPANGMCAATQGKVQCLWDVGPDDASGNLDLSKPDEALDVCRNLGGLDLNGDPRGFHYDQGTAADIASDPDAVNRRCSTRCGQLLPLTYCDINVYQCKSRAQILADYSAGYDYSGFPMFASNADAPYDCATKCVQPAVPKDVVAGVGCACAIDASSGDAKNVCTVTASLIAGEPGPATLQYVDVVLKQEDGAGGSEPPTVASFTKGEIARSPAEFYTPEFTPSTTDLHVRYDLSDGAGNPIQLTSAQMFSAVLKLEAGSRSGDIEVQVVPAVPELPAMTGNSIATDSLGTADTCTSFALNPVCTLSPNPLLTHTYSFALSQTSLDASKVTVVFTAAPGDPALNFKAPSFVLTETPVPTTSGCSVVSETVMTCDYSKSVQKTFPSTISFTVNFAPSPSQDDVVVTAAVTNNDDPTDPLVTVSEPLKPCGKCDICGQATELVGGTFVQTKNRCEGDPAFKSCRWDAVGNECVAKDEPTCPVLYYCCQLGTYDAQGQVIDAFTNVFYYGYDDEGVRALMTPALQSLLGFDNDFVNAKACYGSNNALFLHRGGKPFLHENAQGLDDLANWQNSCLGITESSSSSGNSSSTSSSSNKDYDCPNIFTAAQYAEAQAGQVLSLDPLAPHTTADLGQVSVFFNKLYTPLTDPSDAAQYTAYLNQYSISLDSNDEPNKSPGPPTCATTTHIGFCCASNNNPDDATTYDSTRDDGCMPYADISECVGGNFWPMGDAGDGISALDKCRMAQATQACPEGL